ncbi:E3 ubiquitin-protein ligase TRIM39-like [Scomber japonicus]|uniref:E3 ubiquitin-protein ligase TRIM39-like n=1 Tax=Scomber japonicus TaxID=13676 RepID=UPI002304F7FB|nr:E3 ubiquitin-protein ligase TRIM39-like [Scomber japonicus]
MSAASCLKSEDQFLCSICLDVFTDPVTTPCGHNFCKNCINEHWNSNDQYPCPLCKKVFNTRPELHINSLLNEFVAQFRQEAQQKAVLDHKTHKCVPLKEEYEGKKAELGKTEVEIQEMIEKKRLKIEEIKNSVELSEEAADREKAEGVQVFTALKETVERSLNELIETIEEKQRTTEKQAEDLIKELEQEISELKKRSSEVEKLSHSEDHLHLLLNFSSLKAAPPTKDWTEVSVHPSSYEGTVVRAVSELEETLSKQMKKLFEAELSKQMKKLHADAELKRVQQYAVDVTLDPDTAYPKLILSKNKKQYGFRSNR